MLAGIAVDNRVMEYTVELTMTPPQHAAVMAAEVAHDGIGPFLGRAFGQVMSALQGQGLFPVGPPFGRYDFSSNGFFVEAGFPTATAVAATDEVHDIELPGGQAATTMHIGAYDGVAGAYQAIEAWMTEHGYAPTGAPWEAYLDGPEVAEPRTVVTWPCKQVG